MRLIFINRFYWPDEPATSQLLTDLAEALAQRGHYTFVIASRPRKVEETDEWRKEVRIRRVWSTRLSRYGILGKALDFLTFYLGALIRLACIARRDDVVIAMTDPPLLGLGTALVARFCHAPVIHWIQDVYPEIAMEVSGHRWLRVIRPLRNYVWRSAARCVVIGPEMEAIVAAAGVPLRRRQIIRNWPPSGLTPPVATAAGGLREAWGLTDKFVVGYSGNLGRVHDLESVLALAEALRESPKIVFAFIGGGAQLRRLKATVRARRLPNVVFHPAQPRARLSESLGMADIHLVTLRPGCEAFVVPSKFYGIAAVGRPIIFVGPSHCELARIVIGNHLGLIAQRESLAALADDVRALAIDPERCALYGVGAARFARAHGGVNTAVQHWGEAIGIVRAFRRDQEEATLLRE